MPAKKSAESAAFPATLHLKSGLRKARAKNCMTDAPVIFKQQTRQNSPLCFRTGASHILIYQNGIESIKITLIKGYLVKLMGKFRIKA